MLSIKDFDLLKLTQYCDNPSCSSHKKVGEANVGIHSRVKGQVYCKICKNIWVVTKGTIFFGLKTNPKKVIETLQLLVRGMGLNNTSRQTGFTTDSISSWLKKAAAHSEEFTVYMQQEMHLEQVQIDEFWSFIKKKRTVIGNRKKSFGRFR